MCGCQTDSNNPSVINDLNTTLPDNNSNNYSLNGVWGLTNYFDSIIHNKPVVVTLSDGKRALNLALKIHKIFKCNTLSRIDFIFNKEQEKFYFLEINSQPGMTKLSLLPEQAEFQNIEFENIILNLIDNAK